MPNECENVLEIEDMSDDLRQYLNQNLFSFENMNPPAAVVSQNGGWDIIEAQNNAWSTKWDLDEEEQDECRKALLEHSTCQFITAWSPPLNAILALSTKFPDDKFKLHYYEPGFQAGGTLSIHAGYFEEDLLDFDDDEAVIQFLQDCLGYQDEDTKMRV